MQNLEFVLQQMHTALMVLTREEANDIVANSRKNPLETWWRLQKRYDPTTGGRKRNLLRTIISLGRCSLLELQAGIERWQSYVSRCEKMTKDKLDDEIKLAGLGVIGAKGIEERSDPQLESLANIRGRPPGSRDVRGGEVRFENS